ncbi:VTT domain-containing protein [Kitasatospora camelliae]|uniref:VTT domain-containing protein n=1 Tax=Kitasatospora camelliae TaxID=3156397 RepID=A0AAU8JU56_9ACTN
MPEALRLLDQLAELLRSRIDSPWLWAIVLVVAGLDALVPLMPSEATVVTVAVLVGPDPPRLALLVLVAAAGAFGGDCLGHALGRRLGPAAVAALLRGEAGRRRYAWGRRMVERHAATLLLTARYLPGGRAAAGLATGALRFPLRRFLALDALGAALWALTSTAIGLLGAAAADGHPVRGLLLSTALALLLTAAAEATRRHRARR